MFPRSEQVVSVAFNGGVLCRAACLSVLLRDDGSQNHRPELRARKTNGPKIAMVTAYDATMPSCSSGRRRRVLVGDSLGMVVQGLSNTLPVTLDEMCYHGRAVARAAVRAHVMGDLPFMSYQASPERAVESAGKLLKEGGCESVKLEGGREFAEHVRRITASSIPVMAHIGLTPQSVHAMGGFKVQGRASKPPNACSKMRRFWSKRAPSGCCSRHSRELGAASPPRFHSHGRHRRRSAATDKCWSVTIFGHVS